MHTLLSAVVFLTVVTGPATADICVTNQDDTRYLFVAETDGGERVTGWLDPGQDLCAKGPGPGRVSVFEDEDSFEGCTRLIQADGEDTLLAYVAFDRCRWALHLR